LKIIKLEVKNYMKTNNYLQEKIIRLILIVFIFLSVVIKIEAQDSSKIQGVWEGVLQLKFVWKIDRDAQGNLIASLNIPDQKAYNIPVQNVLFKGDSLFLEINLSNSQRSSYAGIYNKQKNIIEGYYSEGANKYPMTLTANTQLLENMAPRVDSSGNRILKYHYQVPKKIDDDWQTASLSEAGIDSTYINRLMEKILDESYKKINGILIVKDNKLVLEEYFYGYKRDQKHFIASVTKSVTGTCAGIAMDKKLITDLNTPLYKYFPEYSSSIGKGEKKEITLYHLLTMATGFQWDEQSYSYLDSRNNSVAASASGDCIKYLFDRPLINKPGEKFVYNSDLPVTMGEIIKKTSGLRLDKFAEKYLFAPLHIKDYHWEVMPDGRIQAGGGLSLLPRDMAKLGELYLNEGEYMKQRVVSREWLQKCGSRITRCEGPEYWNHWGPHQYQVNDRIMEVFSGAGLGGQWIFGVPSLNLVIALTSDFFGSTEYGPDLMNRYILPAVVTPSFVDEHPDFGVKKIKELPGLKWEPKLLALLGCIKGCLNYLNKPVPDAWLYGATGCAFMINIHKNVYPYSVGRWDKEKFYQLGKNIGYETENIVGENSRGDFRSQQMNVWDTVRKAIDNNFPCYGYPLSTTPEIYLIYGYGQCGYYYKGVGSENGDGPKLWKELGLPDHYFEIHIVKPCEPAHAVKTIKDALNFAIEFSSDTNKWIGPEFKSGPAAYDQWIAALRDGNADAFGNAFNALVWSECRSYAAPFLTEAKNLVNPNLHSLFDEAILHYQKAAENLQKVSGLFPCFTVSSLQREDNLKNKEVCNEAINLLTAAKEEDSTGFNILRNIIAQL
jgi:CubicO group peptidase (beta-lactamase class C family)